MDGRCNKYPFVRLPQPHSPLGGLDGESDHFYSSAFTTRECARPDVIFCGGGSAKSDFHLYANPPCARLCARLTASYYLRPWPSQQQLDCRTRKNSKCSADWINFGN